MTNNSFNNALSTSLGLITIKSIKQSITQPTKAIYQGANQPINHNAHMQTVLNAKQIMQQITSP